MPAATWEFKLRFLTPAFLGDARQDGQWRTPPLKALLRHWWRVAYAAGRNPPFDVNVNQMRRDESALFGGVERRSAQRSRLRLRLDYWGSGSCTSNDWGTEDTGPGQRLMHPEHTPSVGPLLYLGFGPLGSQGIRQGRSFVHATVLKRRVAIRAGETCVFRMALVDGPGTPVPDDAAAEVETALALANLYGTLGSRSRNGWGSFVLEPLEEKPPLTVPRNVFRPWKTALSQDWPHALGTDHEDAPLIWMSAEPFNDWRAAMRCLALVRMAVRTQFTFTGGHNVENPEARHWLSYPVTGHHVRRWKSSKLRLPNTLRFAVRPDANNPRLLRAVVFHVPCRPPAAFSPNTDTLIEIWTAVHNLLDELMIDPRDRSFAMIADLGRRAHLKNQLASIRLVRVPS